MSRKQKDVAVMVATMVACLIFAVGGWAFIIMTIGHACHV
jgi:uncharacterized membrane protein